MSDFETGFIDPTIIVARLEQKGVIDLSTIDFRFKNPESVNEVLGHWFTLIGGVEIENPLTAQAVKIALSNRSETTNRFIDIWDATEFRHGEAIEKGRELVGAPKLKNRTKIPPTMPAIGFIASISPGFHDNAECIFAVQGRAAEEETIVAYDASGQALRDIGEDQFAETAVKPIRADEGGHRGFQDANGLQLWERMSKRQKTFTSSYIQETTLPVGIRFGALARDRMRRMGRIVSEMPDNYVEDRIVPIDMRALKLLGVEPETMDPFLAKRYRKCVEMAHDAGMIGTKTS